MAARSLTASAPAWSLAGLVATHPRGRLDLALPAAGIGVPAAGDSDHLLALDLRSPRGDGRLVDHWLRGDDLVAALRGKWRSKLGTDEVMAMTRGES